MPIVGIERWRLGLADFVDRLAGHAVTRASDSDRMAYDLAFAGGPGVWQLPRRLANFPRHPQRGTYRFAMTRRAVRLVLVHPKKRARAPRGPPRATTPGGRAPGYAPLAIVPRVHATPL